MLQSVGGFGGITYGARMNEYNVWGNPNESEEKVFKMHRKTFARFLKVLTASHKKARKTCCCSPDVPDMVPLRCGALACGAMVLVTGMLPSLDVFVCT